MVSTLCARQGMLVAPTFSPRFVLALWHDAAQTDADTPDAAVQPVSVTQMRQVAARAALQCAANAFGVARHVYFVN